ncbi:MAG: VCBS repeat-containing protein, partial [Acidobacteriota bacterium]
MTQLGAALAGAALLAFAPAAPLVAQPFEDVTKAAGIAFEHRSAPEKKYILESMSGGVAVLDVDLDGNLDLYFVNSLTVETAKQPETAPSALYLNQGDGTFKDVAKKAGVAYPGWGVGVCTADLNGDAAPEIYVTGVGANKLYMNRGDGTFEEKAAALGAEVGGWSAGCGFADYDRDGDLDLFVTRYVEVDLDNLPVFGEGKTCQYRGIAVQCGPRGLPGTTDVLLRNDGGRFTDVSKKAGVHDPDEFFGLGIAWVDVDDDGWLDLYVANDSGPNYLYRNQGDGTFEELGFPLGVAVSEDGGEQGGMGVAVGDYRNDGRMAIFVTNFSEEYNTLYANQGDFFTDDSFRSSTAPTSLRYVGWGTALLEPLCTSRVRRVS